MKKILGNACLAMLGLACDAAIIHNTFWQDRWNPYCRNYITAYKVFSWFAFAIFVLALVCLVMLNGSKRLRELRPDTVQKMAKTFRDTLYERLYRWLNTYPMLAFVAIFFGDVHLFTVWALLAIVSATCRYEAKILRKHLDEEGIQPRVHPENVSMN